MCVFVRKIVGRYFPVIRVSAEKIVGVGIEGNTDGLGKKKKSMCVTLNSLYIFYTQIYGVGKGAHEDHELRTKEVQYCQHGCNIDGSLGKIDMYI